MKKILFSVLALAASGAVSAQEEATATEGYSKGNTFITGSLGFSTQKNNDSKTTQFLIAPSVGFFVTDKIALGGSFTYGHRWDKSSASDAKNTQNTYAPSVFGRYYFTPANKFSIFAHAEAGLNYLEYRNEGNEVQHNNTVTAMAGGGINYFITPHFALQSTLAIIQYTEYDYNASANDDKNTALTAQFSLSNIQFGMAYKF